jgi:hypothetical protein
MKSLRTLEQWGRGFEFHSRLECLFAFIRCLRCSVFALFCVGSGLATGCSPVQGVLRTVCKIQNFRLILNENRPKGLIRQRKKKKKNYK